MVVSPKCVEPRPQATTFIIIINFMVIIITTTTTNIVVVKAVIIFRICSMKILKKTNTEILLNEDLYFAILNHQTRRLWLQIIDRHGCAERLSATLTFECTTFKIAKVLSDIMVSLSHWPLTSLTSESYQFIVVTYVVNLVKFLQMICKISLRPKRSFDQICSLTVTSIFNFLTSNSNQFIFYSTASTW